MKPNCFLCKNIAPSYNPTRGYQDLECVLGLIEGSLECLKKFELREDLPQEELEEYEEEAWDYVGKRFLKALEKSEERAKEREEFLALRKRLTTPVIGKKEEVGE